jgi:hypothetical protein
LLDISGRAATYRRHAEQLRTMAERPPSPDTAAKLNDLASDYDRAAEELEAVIASAASPIPIA